MCLEDKDLDRWVKRQLSWEAEDRKAEKLISTPGACWSRPDTDVVFDWLVRKHLDCLVRVAFKYVRNLDDAEDIVREKVLAAFERVQQYRPSRYTGNWSPFLAWLWIMTSRGARRLAKQQSRRREKLEALFREKMGSSSLDPIDGRFEAWSTVRWVDLQPYIDKLSPKYRQAIRLKDVDGVSHREAAAVAGCTEPAMHLRVLRAHQKLGRLLRGTEFDPKIQERRLP